MTAWRNKRLTVVEENTVLKEISQYIAMFTYAQKELFLLKENPWKQITKPKKTKARDRRIHPSEVEMILKALDYEHGRQPVFPQHYVAWGFLFALETAMRKGEILGITCNNIDPDYIHLPITKNGDARDVRLSKEVHDLLNLLPYMDRVKLIPHN